jgi:hypothetical protein
VVDALALVRRYAGDSQFTYYPYGEMVIWHQGLTGDWERLVFLADRHDSGFPCWNAPAWPWAFSDGWRQVNDLAGAFESPLGVMSGTAERTPTGRAPAQAQPVITRPAQ